MVGNQWSKDCSAERVAEGGWGPWEGWVNVLESALEETKRGALAWGNRYKALEHSMTATTTYEVPRRIPH